MAARTDVNEPELAATLLLAHNGTAYFVRKLTELSDAQLDEPSLLDGWSRRHVIAHVAHNARALARLIEWAATGVETLMYASPEQRNDEVDRGATLSPNALRTLLDEATLHLANSWHELPADAWSAEVRTAQGRAVPAAETVWMRAREVWLHAIDLGNGADVTGLPAEFVDRLLPEIVELWSARGDAVPNLLLLVTDRDGLELRLDAAEAETPTVLTGSAAQLLAWAAGRPASGIELVGGLERIPAAPRWL